MALSQAVKESLRQQLAKRIVEGLKRNSIANNAQWAQTYRWMDAPFAGRYSFKYHPWAYDMHVSRAIYNVGMKAAQMGYTETMLNIVFALMDLRKWSCLYVLPTKTPAAKDFSASRFDPALELSEHIKNMFSDTDNVGHKRAGSSSLFVRGSRSRTDLKSIPVPLLIFDEFEEMMMKNIPLAMERVAGQMEYLIWMISTPSLPGVGIHAEFEQTNKQIYRFKCPHCGRHPTLLDLDAPDLKRCLIITADSPNDPKINNSHLVCPECKGVLSHEHKHEWLVGSYWEKTAESEKNGFWIPQLYSSTAYASPVNIAKAVLKAENSPADEQELWNSKLGLPHEVKGARISLANIENCRSDYVTATVKPRKMITMGCDVGSWLHCEITDWVQVRPSSDPNTAFDGRVIATPKVLSFRELGQLMQQYQIQCFVGDARPETRKMMEFCLDFPERAWMCYYPRGLTTEQIKVDEMKVKVDRTSWLDMALSRFKDQSLRLPADICEEYTNHIQAPVRTYKSDPETGEKIATYVSTAQDHFAHARVYSEVALNIIATGGQGAPITRKVL